MALGPEIYSHLQLLNLPNSNSQRAHPNLSNHCPQLRVLVRAMPLPKNIVSLEWHPNLSICDCAQSADCCRLGLVGAQCNISLTSQLAPTSNLQAGGRLVTSIPYSKSFRRNRGGISELKTDPWQPWLDWACRASRVKPLNQGSLASPGDAETEPGFLVSVFVVTVDGSQNPCSSPFSELLAACHFGFGRWDRDLVSVGSCLEIFFFSFPPCVVSCVSYCMLSLVCWSSCRVWVCV